MNISRSWATPLTMGAFLLMGVTGVLMFFHLDTGLNKEAHEWLGWALVIGATTHAVANGSAFMRHLSQPLARGIVGVFAALLIGSFFVTEEEGGNPGRLAVQALTQAPLSRLAALRGESPEALMVRLRSVGFRPEAPDQTLGQLTGTDHEAVGKALGAVLAARP